MGGLGGTSGLWRRRLIGSVMVVLASFRHANGIARHFWLKQQTTITMYVARCVYLRKLRQES
jgi:hypothetical protein